MVTGFISDINYYRARTAEEVCEMFNNKSKDRTIARGTAPKVIHKFEKSGI